ncbi:MAG TPA: glycosyltransferase, partial [Bacilli bacterium]|nr:glycosyltransferase [Bacilli bacterium]
MVIVFVVDNLKNLSNGTSITAYRFANKLREQGHEVRIITDELTGENIYTLKTRNIPIVSKVAKRQNVTFAKPDKKIIKEALTGADIVHFFVPWKTSRITYKIAKKMGIPMTCAFHVPPASIVYGAGLRFIEKPLLWYIFRRFRRFYKKIK